MSEDFNQCPEEAILKARLLDKLKGGGCPRCGKALDGTIIGVKLCRRCIESYLDEPEQDDNTR